MICQVSNCIVTHADCRSSSTRREKISAVAVPKCEHQHTAGHNVKSVPDCEKGWATQEYAKHTISPESDRSDPSTMLHRCVSNKQVKNCKGGTT